MSLVSVVIPTLNEEKTIEATLNSLVNQDYKGKYEIIIVDGNSTDGTRKIISKFKDKNIRVFTENDGNIAKARNIGIKNSKGKIIAFIDAGRIAPRNWLRNIVNSLKRKDIAGVGGTFRFINKNLNVLEKFTAFDKFYRIGTKKRYTSHVCTGNAGFKKEAIEKVGGFDEFFAKRGENSDLCYTLIKHGNKILIDPSIFVYYSDSYDIKKFLKEHFLNGFYHFFLYMKHKDMIFGEDYKRDFLKLQVIALLFSFFLSLINPLLILLIIPLFLFLNMSFLSVIFRRDRKFTVPAFFLQIIRTAFWSIGAFYGGLRWILK